MLKRPHPFYEPQLTCQWKYYTFATQPKTFLTLQIFQTTFFCLVSEKTFAQHHSWRPRTTFLKHFETKCLYTSVYLRKKTFVLSSNFCSKILSGWEVGWGESLNYFLNATRCMTLVECFTIFHFHWNFSKPNHFSAFWYFHI